MVYSTILEESMVGLGSGFRHRREMCHPDWSEGSFRTRDRICAQRAPAQSDNIDNVVVLNGS